MASDTPTKPTHTDDGTPIAYSVEAAEVFRDFGRPFVARYGKAHDAEQAAYREREAAAATAAVFERAYAEKQRRERAEEAARAAAEASAKIGVNLAQIAANAAEMARHETERAAFRERLDRLAVAKRHLDASTAAPLFSEASTAALTAAGAILDELASSAPDDLQTA